MVYLGKSGGAGGNLTHSKLLVKSTL